MLHPREATEAEAAACGLSYRVYEPTHVEETSLPLVVLVHGRAGDSKVMWLFSKVVEQQKPLVVSPQAPLSDPIGGFSWWLVDSSQDTSDTTRNETTDETMVAATDRLAAFITQIKEVYGIRPPKVIGIGFSQGGAVLSALSLRQPHLFSGVAMLASFVPRAAFAMQPQVLDTPALETQYFLAHGTKDTTVAYEQARAGKDALIAAGAKVVFHSDEVGHKVSSAGVKALQSWIAALLSETR